MVKFPIGVAGAEIEAAGNEITLTLQFFPLRNIAVLMR